MAKRFQRPLKIRGKLVLIALVSCAVALGVAGAGLFSFQRYWLRRAFLKDTESIAEMVAMECSGPVSFDDRASAREVLLVLHAKWHVVSSRLDLPDGTRFCEVGRPSPTPAIAAENAASTEWESGLVLRVWRPVVYRGETLAWLLVRADLSPGYRELNQVALGLGALVLGLGLLTAWLVVNRLHRVVTGPISNLAATAESIGHAKDYALRVPPGSDDEVGVLIRAFNDMLTRIQSHDAALRSANHELADEVAERLRTERALRERLALEALNADVGRILTLNADLEAMLRDCCAVLVHHVQADAAQVWIQPAHEKQLVLLGSARRNPQPDPPPEVLARAAAEISRLAATGQRLLTHQAAEELRIQDLEWVRQEGIVGLVCCPLVIGDRILGALVASAAQAFSEAAAQAVSALAHPLVLALHRKQTEQALHESEARFRTLFENAPVGIYRATPEGRLLLANPALLRMLGCQHVEQLQSRDPGSPEVPGAAGRWRLPSELEAKGELLGGEWTWVRCDGQSIVVRESAKVVRDAAGQALYHEGIVEDITSRRAAEAELNRLNRELMELSRQAGMAEVATGVLHNVGNVLNSINVSVNLLQARITKSKVVNLFRTADLLREHTADLHQYLTTDPKGRIIPEFIIKVAEVVAAEQRAMQEEFEGLLKNLEHVKEIVAMQQTYARVAGVVETLPPESLVQDALRVNEAALSRHGVRVVREFRPVAPVAVDKHKVLQILTNLIRNAKYALDHAHQEDRCLTLTLVEGAPGFVRIEVQDNGVGIAPENLDKIFAHGFTTKKEGHGFGLHSAALAAKELGGSLAVRSDGLGRGATFKLELPVAVARPAKVAAG